MSDYLERQQRKFEDYAEKYRSESNGVFRELVKQLILVATVFLSASVIIVNQQVLNRVSPAEINLLMVSWILLATSMIFGIIQFFVDYKYLGAWMLAKSKVVELIYLGKIKTEKELSGIVEETQKDIKGESLNLFVYLQVLSLIVGIFFSILVLSSLLFSSTENFNSFQGQKCIDKIYCQNNNRLDDTYQF